MREEEKKLELNVLKDMRKFGTSVRNAMQKGELFIDVGENAIRESRLNVMTQLIDIKEKMMDVRAKMEREESLSSESNDEIELRNDSD